MTDPGSILDPTGDPDHEATKERLLDALKLLRMGAMFFTRSWVQLMLAQTLADAGATEEEETAGLDPVVLFEGLATLDPLSGLFHLTPEGVHLLRLGEQLLASADDEAPRP